MLSPYAILTERVELKYVLFDFLKIEMTWNIFVMTWCKWASNSEESLNFSNE